MGIYSNMAAQMVMPVDESPMGLLEFSVRAQNADTAMFESMIELDIVDYYTESGQIVLSETETMGAKSSVIKNIFHKLAELFQKAWNALKEFAQSITVRIQEFFKINKKLVDKYEANGKTIDLEAAKKNDPEKKIKSVVAVDSGIVDQKNTREKITRAYNKISSADISLEDAKSTKEELDSAIKSFTSSESFEKNFREESLKNIGPGTLDSARKFLLDGHKKLLDDIIGDTKSKMDEYKKARTEALKAAAGAKGDEKEKVAAKFSLASSVVSAYSKYINQCSRVVIQSVAVARKTYLAIAIAANKKAATNESVIYDDILELALEFNTDNFVEESTFA